jgi:hypothetical protein
MLFKTNRPKRTTGIALLVVGTAGSAACIALPTTDFPHGFATGVFIGLALVGLWVIVTGAARRTR